MLVPARGASPLSIHRLHSLPGSSTHLAPFSRRHISSQKAHPPQENLPTPAFSLWAELKATRPAVRYTVYAGIGLMATAESTFWFNVARAKYFPSTQEEEKGKADQFLQELQAAMQGYKAVWMGNYGRYYDAYIWGADYGGLDGLQ
ncbi:hypothetical protein EKO04_010087 [Ascochyta lentis]|uniref:Uncharacterized protein n=1 Tax=Ascochyta lentis TaxID=205686 RepID=A0A8H7IWJ8_9PLEO|nr:hypothetical protein EKO04_010087 [Ascochyta lentis]